MLKSVKSHGYVSLKWPLSCAHYELIDTTRNTSLAKGSRFANPRKSEVEEATHEKKPQNRKPPQKHSVNQFDFDESEEEILSLSCTEEEINTVDNHPNKIFATMKSGGKEVKTLIDSGASCNVLPIKYFPQRNCGWEIESHAQDVLKVNHVSHW